MLAAGMVINGHLRALGRKAHGNRFANAAARAGNQRDLII
jgi:hypothetical protein